MKILIRLFQVLRLIAGCIIISLLIIPALIEWIAKGNSKLRYWIDNDFSETLLKPFNNA